MYGYEIDSVVCGGVVPVDQGLVLLAAWAQLGLLLATGAYFIFRGR
ncbi:hypothetical protein ACFFSH_37485 [Streptomyces filamentosus]|nr:hypothetical protein [Streptomyces filamentosus]